MVSSFFQKFTISIGLLILAASANAQVSTWEGSSGVSPAQLQQPWALTNSSTTNPTLESGVLTLSTDTNQQNLFYGQSGAELEIPELLRIEASVRVGSSSASNRSRASTSIVFQTLPNVGGFFNIATDRIFLNDGNLSVGPSADVATTDAFHTYRIEVQGLSAGSPVRVYRDGVLELTGQTFFSGSAFSSEQRILWGDISRLAHGLSEWKSFQHNSLPLRGEVTLSSSDDASAQSISGSVEDQLAEINSAPNLATQLDVNRHSDLHVSAGFDCDNPPAPPLDLAYLSANEYLDDADEVTLDNCSSAWYRFTFELPPNFRNATITGMANVDDVGVLYLNGNRITASVNSSDLGEDREQQGQRILSWPTTDPFSCVDAECFLPGTNELIFGIHGDLSDFDPTGLEFTATVSYELEFLLGDANQDGEVNFLDIQPFISILSNQSFLAQADCNQDGVVDFLDISAFIDILAGN